MGWVGEVQNAGCDVICHIASHHRVLQSRLAPHFVLSKQQDGSPTLVSGVRVRRNAVDLVSATSDFSRD